MRKKGKGVGAGGDSGAGCVWRTGEGEAQGKNINGSIQFSAKWHRLVSMAAVITRKRYIEFAQQAPCCETEEVKIDRRNERTAMQGLRFPHKGCTKAPYATLRMPSCWLSRNRISWSLACVQKSNVRVVVARSATSTASQMTKNFGIGAVKRTARQSHCAPDSEATNRAPDASDAAWYT